MHLGGWVTVSDESPRQLWRALFETAQDAVLVMDQETFQILHANPSACEMYGMSQDELCSMSILDISAEPEATRRGFEEGTKHIALRWHNRADGTTFPVEASANQLVLDGQRVRVAYIRDISDRLGALRALEASEAKFAAAFKTSPDSINLNRLSDGLYLEINDGFTRLTGYTADEVVGKTSAEIGIWADAEDRRRLVEGLGRDGEVENLEADFRCKDGTSRTALMSARVVEIDGEPCILSVTRDISGRKRDEKMLLASNEQLEKMVYDVAEAIGRVVERRDPYTRGHQERVARIAKAIAIEMDLPDQSADGIELAGLLHDVGKLAIPAEILNKPGRLSALEFELIKMHAEWGYEVLKDIDFPWPIARVVLQHQERLDGSGYPAGLEGEAILLEARVLAVADVVEAMASFRPYRPALGLAVAMEEIASGNGKYDARVASACSRLYERGDLAFLES